MSAATMQMATVTSQAILERGTDGYSRERSMSPAPTLTPPLALDYLRELSADIRSGVVLDAAGKLLAGPEELGEAARDLVQAAGAAEEIHVSMADGGVFAARSDKHALVAVYPNPLNPERYVVLNSSFTFRDYDYLNNARQTPKLPDWAVIDLKTPPNSRYPGAIPAADFFGEKWELK